MSARTRTSTSVNFGAGAAGRDLGAKGDSLSDWSTDMRRHIAFGLAGMAFLLVAAAPPAAAAEKTTVCTMDFTLKGWSAGYKTAKGEGTISCDNGQTAEVRLHAIGGGLTAGKSAVRDGRGKFTPVADVGELFGDYASAGAAAGAGPSSEVQALTKGEVSLSLTGKGTGVELGVSFGKFTISRR